MEGIILDCSLTKAWCFKDEHHSQSESVRLQIEKGIRVAVPSIWTLEVINVLRIAEKRKRITSDDTQRYCQWLFFSLPIEIDSMVNQVTFHTLLSLMREYDLTAYDAAYIELAQRRGWPLATLDEKMKKAARMLNILYE